MVMVSNDDNVTEDEARENRVSLHGENNENMGFTDPRDGLSYYKDNELNILKKRGDYSYDPKTGEGKIRIVDNPSSLDGQPYKKATFTSYITVVNSDGVRRVIGKIQYTFVASGGKASSDGKIKVTQTSSFTKDALKTINANPLAKKEL